MTSFTAFISDMHLCQNEPEITRIFLSYLEKITTDTEALYILGDLFKFWIGDDDHTNFNEEIKFALKKASQKTAIFLMPGNRDFLLGQNFAKESGCVLLTDPCKIELYGTPTLLTHGDILCTKDIKHRIFRTITRLPYGIKLFLKLPLKIRHSLACNIQKHSAKAKKFKSKNSMAVQENAVLDMMQRFNCNQLIHGHTHDFEIVNFFIANKAAKRISLAEWTSNAGNLLSYYPSGDFEFTTF